MQAALPPPVPPVAGKVVVLTGSSGGVTAVMTVLAGLPPAFPMPIVVALHRAVSVDGDDELPQILARRSGLAVQQFQPEHGLRPGCVSVLPAHQALTGSALGLTLDPDAGWRIGDPTMAELARHYGSGCLGVVLTGRLDDGTAGARAIKRAGGRVVVQDPTDAFCPDMPRSVMAAGCLDLVVPMRRLAAAVVALTMAPGGADLLRVARPAWAN